MVDWHKLASDKGRPLIMGILNITPDSFSDGGRYCNPSSALAHAFDMIDAGAEVIDIGGESTRPGSDPISLDEELGRIMPVIRDLIPSVDVPVSIDTMKPAVAEAAVNLGVSIVNDENGLKDDQMISFVSSVQVPVVIMHMYGVPKTFRTDMMQGDVIQQLRDFFSDRVSIAETAGIRRENIILDPGLGFGTTSEQCDEMIHRIPEYNLDLPVLIGPSRKRFLADMFPGMDRDMATAKVSRISMRSGADILRVHNVGVVRDELERERF